MSRDHLNVAVVRDGGMTLLEVLVAMAILSIGLMGTIPFATTAMSGNVAARRVTEATQLVEEKLEKFRRIPSYMINPSSALTSLVDTNGNPNLDASVILPAGSCTPSSSAADSYEEISRTYLRGCYVRFWNIADNTPRVDMKTVRMHVIWWEASRLHNVNATTIIAAKDSRFY